MKHIRPLVLTTVGLLLLAIATGCATSKAQKQKESLLQAAGFKLMHATTPDQLQMLKTLPDDRVSAVRSRGDVFFVYPIPSRKVFYVGKNSQYLAYQQAAQVATEDAMVKTEMENIKRSLSGPGWEAPLGDWDAQ